MGLGYFFTADGRLGPADRAGSRTRRCKSPGIGVGGKGGSDIDQAGNLGEVVALCDIDEGTLNGKAQKFSSAKKFHDFRKLYDEMARHIDAVTVSTPDHSHALAALIGHPARQARLLPEAAGALGLRVPRAQGGRPQARRLHPDGQPGVGRERPAAGRRAGPVGRDRRRQGGARLDQPADLAAGPQGHQAARPRRRLARLDPLGRVPRRRPAAALRQGHVPLVQVARLARLRHRRHRRHGLPHRQHGLPRPEARPPDHASRPRAARSTPRPTPAGPTSSSSSPPARTCPPSPSTGTRAARTTSSSCPPKTSRPRSSPTARSSRPAARSSSARRASSTRPTTTAPSSSSPPRNSSRARTLDRPETLPVNGKGDQGMKDEWFEAIKAGKPEIAYSNFDIASLLTEAVPARQRRHPRRQDARMGRPRPPGDQRPRGQRPDPDRVPPRLGSHPRLS